MLIGHQKQWDFLKRAAENKRFSHAYLFAGQEKLGKKTLALQWLSFLLGDNDGSGDFKMEKHPEMIFIEPKQTDSVKAFAGKEEIQIVQIRDLIRKLSLKSSGAPFKAAVIDNAHLMNREAQSSLLKTLEEPRGETLLILISDKIQYLFPTILSRVQTVRFNSVAKEEIENYLSKQGVSEKETAEISGLASGRPGVALDLISDKRKLADFNQRIAELDKISNSALCFRFEYVKRLADDLESIKDILDTWLAYLRDILLARFSFSKPSYRLADESFERYPAAKIKNIIESIQTTKFLLAGTNANCKLALEKLMLEF
jgi:DNA polymerase III subunit delta'